MSLPSRLTIPRPEAHYAASMEARSAAPEPDATQDAIFEAARLIRSARYLTAFTGAGISVESGIPPFRGPGGLWNTYDPAMLELSYFCAHPEVSWPILKEIFYEYFGMAKPNAPRPAGGRWKAEVPHHAEHRFCAMELTGSAL